MYLRTVAILAAACFAAACALTGASASEIYASCAKPPTEPVKPLNSEAYSLKSLYPHRLHDIPAEFDWRDNAALADHFSQRSALTWCGSCFAAATAYAITDRFRIHHRKQFGQRALSVQALLNCGGKAGAGDCSGGNFEMLYEYISKHGVTDETCMPYMGLDRSYNVQLPCEETMCRECTLDGSCRRIPDAPKYFISAWGVVSGEEAMKAELALRGPLTCYIYTHLPKFSTYTGGIIPHVEVKPLGNITHVVEVVGYGVEHKTKTPYWTVRNWSGSHWGEDGYFRIVRGSNSLNIEWNCGWAVPSFSKAKRPYA